MTLYSYQNSAVVDGECAGAVAGVAAAVDKPEEQPSLPLGSSTSAGSSTPDGNDAARGAASAESDPLCASQTLSRSRAARLSEQPFVRIAPLAAVGAAGQTSGAVPGERVRTRIRPPLPAYLSLNLVAQWHRSLRKRDDKDSPLKAVLFVLFLVGCATCILLLLYFFYDALGVCRLHSALEPRHKLTSNCMLTFVFMLVSAHFALYCSVRLFWPHPFLRWHRIDCLCNQTARLDFRAAASVLLLPASCALVASQLYALKSRVCIRRM